jgi:hypothetical protein
MPSVRRRISLELIFYCDWNALCMIYDCYSIFIFVTPQSALWVCVCDAPVIRVCIFDAPECALGVRIDAPECALGVRIEAPVLWVCVTPQCSGCASRPFKKVI